MALTFGTWDKLYRLSQYRHLAGFYPKEKDSLTFGELAEIFEQLEFQDSVIDSIKQQVDKYYLKDSE